MINSCKKPTNILLNPVLDYIDENNEIDGSINTLITDVTKQSRSGTVTNV